jgi:hypothetical protein
MEGGALRLAGPTPHPSICLLQAPLKQRAMLELQLLFSLFYNII